MDTAAVVAFTERGVDLARTIAAFLENELSGPADKISVHAPRRLAQRADVVSFESLQDWTRERFAEADALVFVSATGIAVRAIAPFVEDKFRDPAVVAIDERGHFVVPLLSGHVGGANDLARILASALDAQAVISTATDINNKFAVDEWAHGQGMHIYERVRAKECSARLLAGHQVGFSSDFTVTGSLPEGFSNSEREFGIAVSLDNTCEPFDTTLHLVPRVVTLGIGCRKGVPTELVERRVREVLEANHISIRAIKSIASIDVKASEPALHDLARGLDATLEFFDAKTLSRVEGEFSSSEFVKSKVGVDNVCERAAIARGGHLIVKKNAADGVTVALGMEDVVVDFKEGNKQPVANTGKLSLVGIGPGGKDSMTIRAHKTLESSDLIIGYTTYVDLLREEFFDKEFDTTPMRKEVDRCRMALEHAQNGRCVSLVCSGDAGVYGLAGLCYELLEEYDGVELEVISGVTAACSGAAVLGAPLIHDFAVISLSDLLTPKETIEKRLRVASQGDFVICLYNPSSHKRHDYLAWACNIMLEAKDSSTVCGIVHSIGRDGQEYETCTLGELVNRQVDMTTTVFVGNSKTKEVDGKMVTPRGYRIEE